MQGTYVLWLLGCVSVIFAKSHVVAGAVETMDEEVKGNPIEEALDEGLSDLVKSFSTIQNRLKNIKPDLGPLAEKADEELQNGIETITKDITYDNLLEKIKLAKNKIKEIHNKVNSAMNNLEDNWPKANITRHHP